MASPPPPSPSADRRGGDRRCSPRHTHMERACADRGRKRPIGKGAARRASDPQGAEQLYRGAGDSGLGVRPPLALQAKSLIGGGHHHAAMTAQNHDAASRRTYAAMLLRDPVRRTRSQLTLPRSTGPRRRCWPSSLGLTAWPMRVMLVSSPGLSTPPHWRTCS